MRLNVKEHWTAGKTGLQRFNTVILRYNDKLEEFEITVNRFQTLRDLPKEETTMEDNWKGTGEALTSVSLREVQERENKETAVNNGRTRAEEVKAQTEYLQANKQLKKSIRADKQKHVEELAKTKEKAAREGNMKQPYDTTKELAGKYGKPEKLIKCKEGKKITEIQEQRNDWMERFE
ncbi:unnamed protein product [Schistosoma mattheei]|uniref:Uncharacterized protein n=1 Tax=Schistosoma mattheei TaxID=31246 RepID=A0A183P0R1_9TREM|nr:unnamed protein product [Schistosoma mattheei]